MAAWPAAMMVFRNTPARSSEGALLAWIWELSPASATPMSFVLLLSYPAARRLWTAPKPAFQANSKFFKAQPSQPYPQPNLPKKKALLLLDPLFRNEPFQELAPTTRAFFFFLFRAIPSDERRGGHGQLSARRRLPQNVGGMSHRKSIARSSVLQKYLFRKSKGGHSERRCRTGDVREESVSSEARSRSPGPHVRLDCRGAEEAGLPIPN